MSNDNYLIADDDDNTPCFSYEHKNTAHFGNMEDFQKYVNGETGETGEANGDNGAVLETDGGNMLVERRKKLGGR
jgi:hypothetical protein